MIVFLFIWNVLLTLALVLAVLAVLGKFSRLERGVFENLENLRGGFQDLASQVKTLEENLKTLEKNHAYDCSTLAGSLEQAENRIADITEAQEILRQDIGTLLHSTDEHPVLVPVNKGGRPKKVVSINPEGA